MFSKTCEYAIRALIFIAQKSTDGTKIGIKEIAEGIDSPEYFIAKILQDLSRRKLVQSAKGPHGGFYFEPDDLNITIADIVRAVDGDDFFSGCALGLKQCSETHPCPIHHEFKKLRKDLSMMLQKANLKAFTQHDIPNLTFLKRN